MLDIDDPDEDANDGDHLCQHVAKVIQLLLERRRFRDLRDNVLMDISNGSGGARLDDNGRGVARDDRRSREDEIGLVLLDRVFVLDGVRVLGNTLALPCQDGLVDAKTVAVDCNDATVCGDTVSNRDVQDVTGDEVLCLDSLGQTIANHLGLIGRIFLQGGNCLFRTALLGDTDDGIEDQYS